MSKQLNITIDYPDHSHVVLTNERGDTYTSKSEELMNFLHVIPLSTPSIEGVLSADETEESCKAKETGADQTPCIDHRYNNAGECVRCGALNTVPSSLPKDK